MLTGCLIIYFGGVAYLYIIIFCKAFCSPNNPAQNNDNDNRVRVNYHLANGSDDEEQVRLNSNVISGYDNDSSEESESSDDDYDESSWINTTRYVSTFKISSESNESSVPSSAHPKSVKFDPVSREHLTFSRKEYRRKNHEWLASMENYQMFPEIQDEIYLEMMLFKNSEMKVHQTPLNTESNILENEDDLLKNENY